MSGPRIAYIINSLEGGGAALPVPDVIGTMIRSGAQVRLFALSRRDGRAASALDAAEIDYRVSDAGKSDHLAAARWLHRELKAFGPTVIWTSLTQATIIGQIMGLLMRKPVVSWQHNAYLKPANRRLLALTRRLSRVWVADSRSVAALTHSQLGIDPADIMIWPLFHADPDAPAALPPRNDGMFRIGSLGRLHPNKGYDILVAALAIVSRDAPDVAGRLQVVIGGEGAERDRLTGLASQYGVTNLLLAGYQASPRNFLAGLDGYIQPSRAEGLCIAAHEAMQAGLPVIVSDVGEMPHSVLPGETGLIVPPEDAQALAKAIIALVRDPARAGSMGASGRARILSEFSAARFEAAGRAVMARISEWGVAAPRTGISKNNPLPD
ncbi:glycosyltransferase family 4 protein [Sphingobium phenoxybenzoativorans]|uniref:glycosyltransferase family 4 protein n=1 Tax=Sphingobium phenoxybenzoativorans TaxID=1592790 RepID=UPI000B05B1EE|nr:glycosyltransferase family 4 protein [Sphingobium phenoxybenzoativorans]